MKKKLLLLILLSISILKTFASINPKVYIITDDFRNERINKMSEIIYFEQDYKLAEFTFLSFDYANSDKIVAPIYKKKNVNIKQIRVDCNENFCSKISNFIEFVNTSSNANTKLFICEENNLNCNFQSLNIEVSNLIDKQYSTIVEKIKDEIKLKSNKEKDLILFFYISFKQKTNTKNFIQFEKDTLIVDQDEALKLSPKYSSQFSSYQWSPSTNLNCSNCEYPIFNGKESTAYTLSCKDSMGCEVKSKSIYIKVKENCKFGYECIKILFNEIETPKYLFKNKSGRNTFDWTITSNSSGGYQFDLVTTNNCATKYKVIIQDLDGNLIWSREFLKEEVDKRSKNNYLDIYPNSLVFRLSLVSKQEIINEKFVRVKIISYDDKGNGYSICESPRISFAPCIKD
jgi:hypothetical protein